MGGSLRTHRDTSDTMMCSIVADHTAQSAVDTQPKSSAWACSEELGAFRHQEGIADALEMMPSNSDSA